MATKSVLSMLLRLVGKNYQPDEHLPLGLVVHILVQRATWLLRGLFRLQKAVFVGSGVGIRGKRGLTLGRFATLEPHCKLDCYASTGVSIGARTKIGSYSLISCTSHFSKVGKGLTIGSDCGISEYSYFGASGGIDIGDNVIMGQYVSFHSENHIFADPMVPIRCQGVTSKGIRVGCNVWIGAKVTILDGSIIGDNSVVAAGAVVNGEFPPNSVIGGVPARVLKSTVPTSSESIVR